MEKATLRCTLQRVPAACLVTVNVDLDHLAEAAFIRFHPCKVILSSPFHMSSFQNSPCSCCHCSVTQSHLTPLQPHGL